MKKLMIALVLSLPMVAAAGSGPSHDHGRFQEHALERMQSNLNLSEQQKTEIDKIFSEHREKMQTLRSQTHERVNSVLNEEQRAKMATMHEQRKEKWQERKKEMKEQR